MSKEAQTLTLPTILFPMLQSGQAGPRLLQTSGQLILVKRVLAPIAIPVLKTNLSLVLVMTLVLAVKVTSLLLPIIATLPLKVSLQLLAEVEVVAEEGIMIMVAGEVEVVAEDAELQLNQLHPLSRRCHPLVLLI